MVGGNIKDKDIRLNEIARFNKGRFFEDLSQPELSGVGLIENEDEIDCIWYSLNDGYHVPVRTG